MENRINPVNKKNGSDLEAADRNPKLFSDIIIAEFLARTKFSRGVGKKEPKSLIGSFFQRPPTLCGF
jgi:hypothetical protein